MVGVPGLKPGRNHQLLLVSAGGGGRASEGATQNGEPRGVSAGVRRCDWCGWGEGPVLPGVRRLEFAGAAFVCFPRQSWWSVRCSDQRKAVKMTRVRGIANRLTLACVAGNLCKSPFDNGLGALCRRQKGLLCGYLVDAVTVIKTQLCNFTTYVTVKVSAN